MATRESSFARAPRERVVSEFAPRRGGGLSAPTVRRHPFYEPLPKPPEGPSFGRVALRLLRKAVRFLFPGGGRRLSSRGPVVMCSLMIGLAALLMALRAGQSLTPVADKASAHGSKATLARDAAEFPTQAVMDVPDVIEPFDRVEPSSSAGVSSRSRTSPGTRIAGMSRTTHEVVSGFDDLKSAPVVNAFWSESAHTTSGEAVAWPPPLARRPASTESPPRRSDAVGAAVDAERPSGSQTIRYRALVHLQAARRSLSDGRLVDAWHSSRSAAELNASYEVFDDRPELVFAEIERMLRDYQLWQAGRRDAPGTGPLAQDGPQMASASDAGRTQRARPAHARAYLPAIMPGPVAVRAPLDTVRDERASVFP